MSQVSNDDKTIITSIGSTSETSHMKTSHEVKSPVRHEESLDESIKNESGESNSLPPLKLTLKLKGETDSVTRDDVENDDNDQVEDDDEDYIQEFQDEEEDDEESADDVAFDDDYDDDLSYTRVTPNHNKRIRRESSTRSTEVIMPESDEDQMKRMKDPKLMTARQKALMESKSLKKIREATRIQELESFKRFRQTERSSIDNKTLETRLRKAKERRQVAQEKKEKDKKQTIDRLLRKKSSNKSSSDDKNIIMSENSKLSTAPVSQKTNAKVSYISNSDGHFIHIPDTRLEDLKSKGPISIPSVVFCGRSGCTNFKKYITSRSGIPCCSLECYKILEAKSEDV